MRCSLSISTILTSNSYNEVRICDIVDYGQFILLVLFGFIYPHVLEASQITIAVPLLNETKLYIHEYCTKQTVFFVLLVGLVFFCSQINFLE
jgi:hypothetical protein